MKNLKQQLINQMSLADNEYLDQYIKLVTTKHSFNANDIVQSHHVIPVYYYYRKQNINISTRTEVLDRQLMLNSNNFIVELTIADHCLAHGLLFKCATLSEDKQANAAAVLAMLSMKERYKGNNIVQTQDFINYIQSTLINDVDTKYGTYAEVQFLKNNYNNFANKELAKKLNRSTSAIANKIHQLNLNRPSRKGTEAEKEWLKANYANYTLKDCATILNRTLGAVIGAVKKFKLTTKMNYWTNKEIELLRQVYSKGSSAKLEQVFKRPKHDITCKATSLGIYQHRNYGTNIEEQGLAANYQKYSVKQCAEYLQKSEAAIRAKLRRMIIS